MQVTVTLKEVSIGARPTSYCGSWKGIMYKNNFGSNYCNGIFIVIVKIFIFFLTIDCKIIGIRSL